MRSVAIFAGLSTGAAPADYRNGSICDQNLADSENVILRRAKNAFRKFAAHVTAKRRATCAVEIGELLGRKPVNLDTPELQRFLAGKIVLVSGAGGSIGSEICRQTMKFCPSRIVLLDRAENALFEIDRELRERWIGADIVPLVADVCDAARIAQIFQAMQPQVVFHCAAHKHVPMMEANPGEAIKNNIFGTKIVADAAQECGVAAFVMVSTDKAVNPTSVMGASKRVAELYVQSLNKSGQWPLPSGQFVTEHPSLATTRFVAVRFGNVLGSSGSVVPIFRKQIEAGGPVTVTHPEMRRYFMTIPEASQLVMQAGAIGQGGEIFVLDMGEPIRILDLASEMIRRAGLVPDEDIQIQITGIRPGEKLYEELSCNNEQTRPTSHPKIKVWQLEPVTTQYLRGVFAELEAVVSQSAGQIVQTLRRCLSEYTPSKTPVRSPRMPVEVQDQATKLRRAVQKAA
jgi:FlaA1/EpsC-like NDP-sugar epimerase